MYTAIKPLRPLSSNKYSKRLQLQDHIQFLKDVLNNQKFSNEILYDNNRIIDSIKYYNNMLEHLIRDIKVFEVQCYPFGL